MIPFQIKNQSFREAMGNSIKYKVPRFQRDYSWKDEQWEDLWEDILVSIGNSQEGNQHGNKSRNGFHYMGYLVLQPLTPTSFIIIDGQQRLTTISILILAILCELDQLVKKKKTSKLNRSNLTDSNQKRLNILQHSYIGAQDAASLQYDYKLSLNRNNDEYFKTFLCSLRNPPTTNKKPSEKLMARALEYFQKKTQAYFHLRMKGENLAKFINTMAMNLHFTTIEVSSEVNAYTIFETLNARGVQLSTPDLVKNYIFSLIDKAGKLPDRQLKNLESKWSQVVNPLGGNKVLLFIRAHWNSQNTFSRKIDLFKKIRKSLKDARGANNYLDSLVENAPVYAALRNSSHDFWKQHKKGAYNDRKLEIRLQMLNLFNISTPHGALLMAFHKLKPKDFIRLLFYVEVLSVRYSVICGKNPSPLERVYAKVAKFLREASTPSLNKVVRILKEITPPDKEFRIKFEEKIFKTGTDDKQARYFLCRIESFLAETPFSFDDSSLEHILPKNPSKEWIRVFQNEEKAKDWMERLGNMTLLSVSQNQLAEGKNFIAKKKFFQKSPFKVTQQCLQYEEWNEKTIYERQKWLGKLAKSIWRLP